MRVALVASLVSPLLQADANGPHAVIVDLARGLARRRHDVTVYAASGSYAHGLDVVQVPVEPAASGAALRFGSEASADATATLDRAFATLFDAVRQAQPDVIGQHAFDAAAIEMSEGLPVLHTLHLAPSGTAVPAAARATRSALATVSEAARSAWLAEGVSEITVLRNGVPDRGAVSGRVRPVALIAGRISPEKGTETAIRVARRAGLGPLVVGDAYDADYFATRVRPLLRSSEWMGPVSRAGLSGLMARSAVLLMPVRGEEAFGLVAAEAQMAGCPVVGYRRGALAEIVEHGRGGWLVDPDDEEALLTSVSAAIGLDRARIRAHARRTLGVERMIDDHEAALSRVAAGSRATAGATIG